MSILGNLHIVLSETILILDIRDKALENSTNKHGKGLPSEVTMAQKPVYATLRNEIRAEKVPGWKDEIKMSL